MLCVSEAQSLHNNNSALQLWGVWTTQARFSSHRSILNHSWKKSGKKERRAERRSLRLSHPFSQKLQQHCWSRKGAGTRCINVLNGLSYKRRRSPALSGEAACVSHRGGGGVVRSSFSTFLLFFKETTSPLNLCSDVAGLQALEVMISIWSLLGHTAGLVTAAAPWTRWFLPEDRLHNPWLAPHLKHVISGQSQEGQRDYCRLWDPSERLVACRPRCIVTAGNAPLHNFTTIAFCGSA